MRVVVKIGSSSLTDEQGSIRREAIASVSAQAGALSRAGHEVCVVSSGAIAAGVAALSLPARPSDMPTLQALAAAGQPRLMDVWNQELGREGLVGAQALLVPNDFFDRRQYLHIRATITRLLELGCVPVINENDAIAVDEIRFGDNDRISALVAQAIGADVLVLLTDTPGLYTSDPRTDPEARLVTYVDDLSALQVSVGGAGSARGSGGMSSKLAAARMAAWSGVRTVIAKADRSSVLVDAVDGVSDVGTTFAPQDRRLGARKLWIAFAIEPAGSVVVDDGARRALVEHGRSLLPAGVVSADGSFEEGDAVDICDLSGEVFARGLARAEVGDVRRMAGRRSDELDDGTPGVVVHRDDLVVLA